jgi:hypothetical protein
MKVRIRALPTMKLLSTTLKIVGFDLTRGRGKFVGKGCLRLVGCHGLQRTSQRTFPPRECSIPFNKASQRFSSAIA